MINMEDLKKIIKLTLLTGNLKGYAPVSLLVLSKSGNGKTELITSYNKPSAFIVTDISYSGLCQELKKNNNLKHLIIPDFIKITQKKRSTSDNLISLLNALLEEGASKMRVFGQEYDFNKRRLGLITATTKASFAQHKEIWAKFGFVQRMLLVSYDYKDETIEQIMCSINKEEFIKNKVEKLIKSGKDINSEEKFNKQLNHHANKNFRSLKHLQALAKAHALMSDKKCVSQDDINEIIRLTKYMNLNYIKI
jgi:hypothetical protein